MADTDESRSLRSTTVVGVLQLALHLRRRVRVEGGSMEPLLRDGDTVLVNERAYRRSPPRADDVVLARHPFRSDVLVIKRVHVVREDGRLDLRGDNPEASTDSRTLGTFAPDSVLGRVTARYP